MTARLDGVERLLAIEDIKQLKARYWRMLDQNRADLIPGLFAEEAVLDFLKYGQIVGRSAIVTFYRMKVFPAYDMMIHHGANPEIQPFVGGRATGTWQYEAWMLTKQPVGYWHSGWYEDEYVVEDDHWVIKYSKGVHHFNSRIEDQWARTRFDNDDWPPAPGGADRCDEATS